MFIGRRNNMGIYFNPGNGSFTEDKNSQIYVDKTELLKFLNKRLKTNGKCIAVSHARRFGKSHAAGMIDAFTALAVIPQNCLKIPGLHLTLIMKNTETSTMLSI